jgi:hypothetical protein
MGNGLDEVHRLIDKKEDNLFNHTDELHKTFSDRINDLNKYVDSRTDKMADGFSKHIAEINRQIMTDERWALQHEGPTKD